MTDGGSESGDGPEQASFVEYGIEDKPPLGESVLLGVQHYLTMIGATIAVPLALAGAMGMFTAGPNGGPIPEIGRLIGTFFVVSGIATLAQTTIGNRYPIVQGATFSLLIPGLAIIGVIAAQDPSGPLWETAILELQGAVIVAAIFEVFIGYLGIMGRLKRFLSPVVIAPTIALIGLALFNVPQVVNPTFQEFGQGSAQNWWLLGLTLLLIILFSQYLDKYHRSFRLFPVLLGVTTAWVLAAIGSIAEVGLIQPGTVGYVNFGQITGAEPVYAIVPLQWGMPQFTTSFIIGMFAGVLASMIESFGDYHAVARLSGVSAPSRKRINHGIGMEGLGNIFAGIMGTGNGSTSYSENIGAIGLTGVASRYVVQIGAVVMIVVGYIGYFGQTVATIPSPIVGGLFIAMFGQIAAVGLSNLEYVDLSSNRNVFIVGIALFAGLAIPRYMNQVGSPDTFRQGMEGAAIIGPLISLGGDPVVATVSNTIFVIGSTGMAVGGLIAFVLDNTIEGTREERGLDVWETIAEDEDEFQSIVDRIQNRGEDETVAGD
ncbi:xanthine permease [Halobacteriales archaeon QS_8_69_26]|nr:MAG: xanthine permease [Halobacteriales archaeon QS_8_69_26]